MPLGGEVAEERFDRRCTAAAAGSRERIRRILKLRGKRLVTVQLLNAYRFYKVDVNIGYVYLIERKLARDKMSPPLQITKRIFRSK